MVATQKLIKSQDRGLSNYPGLVSYHSFSFAGYIDPENKGWGNLRVINEDILEAAAGFDTHFHRDMEIITYMISGALEHKDSKGNEYTIGAGEVQRISAGSGIEHSEYNASQNEQVKFLQIWIKPEIKQSEPNYEQKAFDESLKNNNLLLIASKDARDGSISILQDCDIYASQLEAGKKLELNLSKEKSWLQIIEGELELDNLKLSSGDGLGLESKTKLELMALAKTHFLIFDM